MSDTLLSELTYIDEQFSPVADCEPTDCYPGTQDRVEVYRRRVERLQPVFHRLDRTFEDATNVIFRANDDRPKPVRSGRPPKPGGPKRPGKRTATKAVTKFVNQSRVNRKGHPW